MGSGVFFGLTLLVIFPLRAHKVVGTDIFHAAVLLYVAGSRALGGRQHRLLDPRLAPARLDPGRPHRRTSDALDPRAAAAASCSLGSSASPASSCSTSPAPASSSSWCSRPPGSRCSSGSAATAGSACSAPGTAGRPPLWTRRLVGRRLDSIAAARGAAAPDPDRPRAPRSDRGCVRSDRAAEGRAEPGHGDDGGSAVLARVRVRSGCRRDLVRAEEGEPVTVDVLDEEGRSVRTLVRDRDEPRGRVSYTWDGRDDAGRVVAEGRYRPRVELEEPVARSCCRTRSAWT